MCGAKRFMLNKNLLKMFSLFTFVMFFCFVLVLPVCFASNPNEETPNGYTPVNDFCSSSDEEGDLDALFEGVEPVQKETNNQDGNLTVGNSQSDDANEEEFDDESWHEEEEEKSDLWEEEEVNREEESSEDETPELEVNDGDYDADDENYYYPGKER